MTLHSASEDGELHSARRSLGETATVHAVVESLAGTGWDWHVWDRAGRMPPYCGVAATLGEAKAQAAHALATLLAALAGRVGRHRRADIDRRFALMYGSRAGAIGASNRTDAGTTQEMAG